MAYDYPGSCAPSRWLPSAPKQNIERGPFGLAHRGSRASPMRAASGCLPPAVRIIPQYVPGFQPRFGACCQSRAIYYQQNTLNTRKCTKKGEYLFVSFVYFVVLQLPLSVDKFTAIHAQHLSPAKQHGYFTLTRRKNADGAPSGVTAALVLPSDDCH